MPRVSIPQLQMAFEVSGSEPLMFELLAHGVPVASSCRGDGICGKCRMTVETLQPLPPPSELEQRTLKNSRAMDGERLSCQLKVEQDMQLKTTYW